MSSSGRKYARITTAASSELLMRSACMAVRARLEAAIRSCGAYSAYPLELTASRTLLLSLYHGLLVGDEASVFALLALEPALPQLGSVSAAVWLCDDFRFRQQDVAVVLCRLALFVEEGAVPPNVVSAFTALGRKHRFFKQDKCENTKASTNSVATQTTSEAVAAQRTLSRLESTPEEIFQEEDESFTDKLPVFYAMSLSMESIPTEMASELRTVGEKNPQTPEPRFETMLNAGFRRTGTPLPSAPSLSAFDETETGQETAGETGPIYENIPAFKEFSSKTFLAAEVVRRRTTNTKRNSYLVENRRSDILLSGVASNMSKTEATKWLLKAAERGNSAEVAIALSSGASTEAKDSLQRSSLHLAVASGHEPVVRMLLDAGADRNKRDALGRTPLHYTALRGRTDLARMLLDGGADPNIRDSGGLTPTILATIKKHREVAALLKSKGGHECCIS